MAEEIENVAEEVTEQPIESTENEPTFMSEGDDSVVKINLDKVQIPEYCYLPSLQWAYQ